MVRAAVAPPKTGLTGSHDGELMGATWGGRVRISQQQGRQPWQADAMAEFFRGRAERPAFGFGSDEVKSLAMKSAS